MKQEYQTTEIIFSMNNNFLKDFTSVYFVLKKGKSNMK